MSERFKILNDYEVLDIEFNMIWRRECVEELTFVEANLYAEQMSKKTGVTWKVPSVKDLFTLLNYEKSPASDFPDMMPIMYWTSNIHVTAPNHAWVVGFHYGSIHEADKTTPLAVRLVRSVAE